MDGLRLCPCSQCRGKRLLAAPVVSAHLRKDLDSAIEADEADRAAGQQDIAANDPAVQTPAAKPAATAAVHKDTTAKQQKEAIETFLVTWASENNVSTASMNKLAAFMSQWLGIERSFEAMCKPFVQHNKPRQFVCCPDRNCGAMHDPGSPAVAANICGHKQSPRSTKACQSEFLYLLSQFLAFSLSVSRLALCFILFRRQRFFFPFFFSFILMDCVIAS